MKHVYCDIKGLATNSEQLLGYMVRFELTSAGVKEVFVQTAHECFPICKGASNDAFIIFHYLENMNLKIFDSRNLNFHNPHFVRLELLGDIWSFDIKKNVYGDLSYLGICP